MILPARGAPLDRWRPVTQYWALLVSWHVQTVHYLASAGVSSPRSLAHRTCGLESYGNESRCCM